MTNAETELGDGTTQAEQTSLRRGLWRDLTAYWILGLCNNFGYVVMLTAAHDIIHDLGGNDDDPSVDPEFKRECNKLSTGAILLADILPALAVKFIAPFLPFYVYVRISICVLLAIASFVFVAYAEVVWVALFGVVFTSLSSGLGEITFLGYSSRYNKNVVSTWSSGTGGAGILGSISYSILTQAGFSSKETLLIMISVPVLEAIVFFFLLTHPGEEETPILDKAKDKSYDSVQQSTTDSMPEEERPLVGFKEQLAYVPSLLKFIIPLTLVYFFEYFINQGLFELIYFPNIWLDKGAQYRWFQVDYQIGVFISRSSVNLFKIKHVWLMAVFQGINVILFSAEAIWYVSPSIWLVLAFIFWEGLLGGGAYVNTFYRISEEISPARRLFALSITALSDSTGIAVAGWLAMPTHNAICKLPPPSRLT